MRALIFAVLATLSSCAYSVRHTPAPPRPAAVHVFDRPFDEVWSALVGWFATNNINLDKIEKASGLLTANCPLATSDSAVDMGKVESVGFWRARHRTVACAAARPHDVAFAAGVAERQTQRP